MRYNQILDQKSIIVSPEPGIIIEISNINGVGY